MRISPLHPRRKHSFGRPLGLLGLMVLGVCARVALADMVLLSETSLVSGSQSAVYSFVTPGAGTVAITISNINWPQPLSSLSMVAATPSSVLSSWASGNGESSPTLYFKVTNSGQYFADVNAIASGLLDLGVYSLSVTFIPAANPVPLPASGWLLLAGCLLLIVLRSRSASGDSAPTCAG